MDNNQLSNPLSRKLLSTNEVAEKLARFKEWDSNGKLISRDFEFADFVQAFAFLTKVAIIAEKMNHHAEIWNVYNKVSLKLSTHDTLPRGGLTEFDFGFVQMLEQAL